MGLIMSKLFSMKQNAVNHLFRTLRALLVSRLSFLGDVKFQALFQVLDSPCHFSGIKSKFMEQSIQMFQSFQNDNILIFNSRRRGNFCKTGCHIKSFPFSVGAAPHLDEIGFSWVIF